MDGPIWQSRKNTEQALGGFLKMMTTNRALILAIGLVLSPSIVYSAASYLGKNTAATSVCDPTTATQCASVNGSGQLAFTGTANIGTATTGGATPYHYLSTASTNSTLVSTGAHSLYEVTLINTTATLYYLRLYDATSAPTCSSGTGVVHTYPIPASASGAGVAVSVPFGVAFTNGLSFCLTGGIADTDNTNAATGVAVNLSYK